MWLLLHGWDSGDFPHHILLQLELMKKVPDARPGSPVPELLLVLEVEQLQEPQKRIGASDSWYPQTDDLGWWVDYGNCWKTKWRGAYQDFQGEWLPVRDKEETLQMCRHCCT
jgi:hypothetical protein